MSSLTRDLALWMYERMLLIRFYEEKVREFFAQGKIPGFVHLYAGEEAVAVGVAANLRKDDYITSTHRGHGHCIAKGCDVKLMMAEIMGKRSGLCKGKGGSMHIADFDVGMLGANGIVGGGAPHAVGAALSAKLRRTGQIAVAFFGDGAINQGVVLESLNLAAIWKLPVVFVVEDNQYAISMRSLVPTELQPRVSAARGYAERAGGFGIPAVTVDGQDVIAVYEVAREAVERARRGDGPTLIHAITYRFYGHFEGDPLAYRSRKEEEEWRKRDPIVIFKNKLLEMRIASSDELKRIEDKAMKEIDDAVKFAEESPYPDLEEAFKDVFVEDYY
jgi:pyruvate dehydrogenase E1 component alpha subunit